MNGVELSARRAVVFVPHPDDESLAIGGSIHRLVRGGAEVRVVYLTGGENNGLAQRYVERTFLLDAAAPERWAARRKAESVAALAILGIPENAATFLRFIDGGLDDDGDGCDPGVMEAVHQVVARFQPDLILAPATMDLHPDHRAAGRAARSALDAAPSGARLYEFVVHGRCATQPVITVRLEPEEAALKRAAILCHASQMALSRQRFLSFVSAEERLYLPCELGPGRLAGVRRLLEVLRG